MVVEEQEQPLTYGTYGDCRRLGHAWFDVPSDWKPSRGVPYTVRCDRCGTERRFQVSENSGEQVASPKYLYPDGYLFAHAYERPTADQFRLMFIEQMVRRQRRGRRKAS